MMKQMSKRMLHASDLSINTQRAINYYKKTNILCEPKKVPIADCFIKSVINDNLSGLYYIDIGKVSELYDTMRLCRNEFPQKQFGEHRIGKFGLSKNISARLKQHQSKRNGYGRWSDSVNLKWMVLMSPSQLFQAEKLLFKLLKADHFIFNYKDDKDVDHKELIIYDPSKESKIKKIYKQVSNLYPSTENNLSQIIDDNKKQYEMDALKKEFEYEMKLRDEKEKNLILQNELLQFQLSSYR